MDGGNVPPEELEAARRRMDPRTFRQEYEASFETIRGVVYYCFDRRKIILMKPLNRSEALHIGMDFNVWGKWRQWFMCCVMGFHGL